MSVDPSAVRSLDGRDILCCMSVDELHQKYLEASFEGFRRTAQSLIATSGGSIVALLGLFRVLLPVEAGVSEIAFRMRWPVVSFIAAIFVAMLALLSSYLRTVTKINLLSLGFSDILAV